MLIVALSLASVAPAEGVGETKVITGVGGTTAVIVNALLGVVDTSLSVSVAVT